MDGPVRPRPMNRIAYCAPLHYQPRSEAISREIALLRRRDRDPVVTIPPFRSPPLLRGTGHGVRVVHPWRLLLRPLAHQALRGADVLHVFTPVPLPRRIALLCRHAGRPTLVTVIACGSPAAPDIPVMRTAVGVVAECERDREILLRAGLPAPQVHLIPPATDIGGGGATPPPATGPFTILFASSPLHVAELAQRGVDLLADVAARLPEVHFRLLWRRGAESALESLPELPNLEIDRRVHADMAAVIAGAHAVVAPFRPGGRAKSVPLSVVEGLRCGRPALVSDAVGLADVITRHGCGVVFVPTVDGLYGAIEDVQRRYAELRQATLAVPDLHGPDSFREAYAGLWRSLLPSLGAGERSEIDQRSNG